LIATIGKIEDQPDDIHHINQHALIQIDPFNKDTWVEILNQDSQEDPYNQDCWRELFKKDSQEDLFNQDSRIEVLNQD